MGKRNHGKKALGFIHNHSPKPVKKLIKAGVNRFPKYLESSRKRASDVISKAIIGKKKR